MWAGLLKGLEAAAWSDSGRPLNLADASAGMSSLNLNKLASDVQRNSGLLEDQTDTVKA